MPTKVGSRFFRNLVKRLGRINRWTLDDTIEFVNDGCNTVLLRLLT